MSSPVRVTRGVRRLRRLLQDENADLRVLDLDGFRSWLDRQLARWQQDPVFVQRTSIRDLRRAHPQLSLLEEEYRRAVAADAATPQAVRLQQLEEELRGTTLAVTGLAAALPQATPDRRLAMRQKLATFQARQRALQDEAGVLTQSSPERQALLRLGAELQQLRAGSGVEQQELVLNGLLRQQGRRSGRAGASFEQLALELTRRYLVPGLLRSPHREETLQRLRVLGGVTLGAARTEFDQLVVRQPRRSGRPVTVLAAVEVKRNVNDLAHGFRLRQENLAWLTGDRGAYEPAGYRTRQYPTGHFESVAAHAEGGETFLFTPRSFRRFQRDPATGYFLERLCLIARAGPLWGVSAAALARIAFRVATDERWEPASASYLRRLFRWCQSLPGPVEAPDVLRLYSASPERARQILVVDR